jgi:hypothetical protein
LNFLKSKGIETSLYRAKPVVDAAAMEKVKDFLVEQAEKQDSNDWRALKDEETTKIGRMALAIIPILSQLPGPAGTAFAVAQKGLEVFGIVKSE